MVKLEEITDADKLSSKSGPYSSAGSSASSSTSSLDSLSSTGSDGGIEKETLTDRLSALVDIIPPTTRHSIASTVKNGASAVKRTTRFLGNAVWILSTSALLVALPLALVLEDENKIVQQEREMMAQQQGQQMLAAGTPFGAPPQGQQGLVPPGF